MDPIPGEQLKYEEEDYGGPKEMQYYGGGPVPALTGDDELIGEDDDEYDELYGDLNVGEGFRKLQLSEAPDPHANGARNGGSQKPKLIIYLEPKPVNLVPKESNRHGVPTDDEKYTNSGGVPLTDPKHQIAAAKMMASNDEAINTLQKEIAPDVSQALDLGFCGSTPAAQNTGIDPVGRLGKVVNESVSALNPKTSFQWAVSQMPPNHSNDHVNMNRQIPDDNPIRATGDNGATMLFVGELQWWTTDVEIESVSSKYGKVKEVKFFDHKVNGKSKGCCHVEFYESAAAAACKNGMNGYNFNGRACTVVFASPHTTRQMGDSNNYMNKSQVQPQSDSYMNKFFVQPRYPSQPQGRRPLNDNAAGRSGWARGYGRGGWERGQRGGGSSRGYSRHSRGIGANWGGDEEGIGAHGFGGPPDGFMHPQGAQFVPTYMGRGFPGPASRGMMPPPRNVNAMEMISGVSPPANTAFFGKGMAANGMGNAGTDGPHSKMWNELEHAGQRTTRESSFGEGEGDSEYGYGYSRHDKAGPKSSAVSGGNKRGSGGERSGNFDKRHRDRERYEREHRYRREEKDDHRRRYLGYKDDWAWGQPSARSGSRSRVRREEDYRSRSRDAADHGKRRRLRSP